MHTDCTYTCDGPRVAHSLLPILIPCHVHVLTPEEDEMHTASQSHTTVLIPTPYYPERLTRKARRQMTGVHDIVPKQDLVHDSLVR